MFILGVVYKPKSITLWQRCLEFHHVPTLGVVRAFCHAWHALVLKLAQKKHRSSSTLALNGTSWCQLKGWRVRKVPKDGVVLQNCHFVGRWWRSAGFWDKLCSRQTHMCKWQMARAQIFSVIEGPACQVLHVWIWFKYHLLFPIVDAMSAICWHISSRMSLESVYMFMCMYIYIYICILNIFI